MTYRHLVLFRMNDQVTDATVDDVVAEMSTLSEIPGVLSWSFEKSLDARKGRVLVEDASFADERAFAAFREHPLHRARAERMREISDWWVGDYVSET